MGLVYSRFNNPNLEILEDRLAIRDRLSVRCLRERHGGDFNHPIRLSPSGRHLSAQPTSLMPIRAWDDRVNWWITLPPFTSVLLHSDTGRLALDLFNSPQEKHPAPKDRCGASSALCCWSAFSAGCEARNGNEQQVITIRSWRGLSVFRSKTEGLPSRLICADANSDSLADGSSR
jgi:hypothetical protein